MFRESILRRLHAADVVPDRGKPWDPVVHHPRFWRRVALYGSLGLGESYMDGDWDVKSVDEFIAKVAQGGLDQHIDGVSLGRRLAQLLGWATSGHFTGVAAHYDTGNDLFEAMLGPTMSYTCAYWGKDTTSLEQAQERKMELICRKLKLQPGMTLLDIGCGWGSLLKYAAQRYQVSGVGITISSEQALRARQRCAGLPIRILVQDYHDLSGCQFDRVASVGMFEHVGKECYQDFVQVFANCLKPEGIGLLHTIGKDMPGDANPWIKWRIFSRGYIPTKVQISIAVREGLEVRHWHSLGSYHYDRTLMAWWMNFERAWPQLRPRYGPQVEGRFHAMWKLYLLGCAGMFRAEALDVWQLVLAHPGEQTGYVCPT